MNNLRLILIGLLVPSLLMIPYSLLSFYTDFANKNPDPSQVTANFSGKSYNAVEGKKAFEQYQCMGCHTIVGNGGYFAPDLTLVNKRTGGNGASLANLILAGAPTKGMPPMRNRGMNEEDAYRVVAFLKYAERIDTNGWPNNGSWDREGSLDSASPQRLLPGNIWQAVLGIIFFNLLVFAIIIAYEHGKEAKA